MRTADPVGGVVPGDPVQIVALVGAEAERAGEARQHLLARLRTALLLQPRVVVGGHRGQQGDLLPPQSGRPAARAGGQSDVGRLEGLAVAAEEVGEGGAVHPSIMRAAPPANQGSRIPR